MKINDIVQYQNRWKESYGLIVDKNEFDDCLVLWGDGGKLYWENKEEIQVVSKTKEEIACNPVH